MTINLNIVNPFKSKTFKTFDNSKVSRDAHADEYLPSADVGFYSGKKIFKFGTNTTVVDVDDNLSKGKPSEHVKPVQSSSLVNGCEDIHAQKQKKIVCKVRSAKNRITKLFKPAGRDSANVPYIDSFVTHGIENRNTTDQSSSLSLRPVIQRAKSEAHKVATYDIIPTLPSLEITASPITYGENVADERIEDLATNSCSIVEASFSSSIREHFATPESPSDALSSTFSVSEPHTIKVEDGRTETAVTTEQRELVPSVFQSCGKFKVSVCFSGNTLSVRTTASEADLADSVTSASRITTSFATSVDAEDSYQILPDTPRVLRRVPSYEDLRRQIIADRDFSCSDLFTESPDCDISNTAPSGVHAAPLRRPMKCDNIRKPPLSSERKIYAPSTRQICKFKKLRVGMLFSRYARCPESSHDTRRIPACRVSSKPQKVTPTSRTRQFVQGILRPSSRVRAHVSKPSSRQSSPLSTPPIWSCAKITRSSSNAKKRQRMTKQSMKELKERLDSMDIDPWY